MKVSVELTDKDVRDAIYDKVTSMLPDEVLGADDPEIEINIYASGVDERDNDVVLDLSSTEDWNLSVEVNTNSNPEHDLAAELDDEDFE